MEFKLIKIVFCNDQCSVEFAIHNWKIRWGVCLIDPLNVRLFELFVESAPNC